MLPSSSRSAVRYFCSVLASPDVRQVGSLPVQEAGTRLLGPNEHLAGFWMRWSTTPSAASQLLYTASSIIGSLVAGIYTSDEASWILWKLAPARMLRMSMKGSPEMMPSKSSGNLVASTIAFRPPLDHPSNSAPRPPFPYYRPTIP